MGLSDGVGLDMRHPFPAVGAGERAAIMRFIT
jgi:hypothetical protein